MAVATNASGKIVTSVTSASELAQLVGIDDNVQDQLDQVNLRVTNHLADPADAHDASEISFDPTGATSSTDVQAAIEELQTDIDSLSTSGSASPGFAFGRSGTLAANTYLLVDGRPSNVAGKVVLLDSGTITKASLVCGTAATFDVKIQRRSGVSFVDLATISVSASRTKVEDLSIMVASGDELAVVVSTGTPDNLGVDLIMQGTT
jgi:hypothetical protein